MTIFAAELLTNKKENIMEELFNEFGNNLSVGDFRITYKGALVTNVVKNPETGEISLYSGNPEELDGYFEELLPERSEYQAIIEQIEEGFLGVEDRKKRYEVYDCNNEVIGEDDSIEGALGCAESHCAQFVYDTETNEVVWGEPAE